MTRIVDDMGLGDRRAPYLTEAGAQVVREARLIRGAARLLSTISTDVPCPGPCGIDPSRWCPDCPWWCEPGAPDPDPLEQG